jgi:hypothetical protein
MAMRSSPPVRCSLAAGLVAVLAGHADAQPVPLGGEILVNTHTTGSQFDPAVASDGAGRFVVVWSSTSPAVGMIRGQRYDSNGAAAGTEFQVTADGTSGSEPSVAVASDGSFLIAWLDDDTPQIVARAYDSDGTPQGTAFRVDTTIFDYHHGYPQAYQDIKSSPEVAAGADGQFAVVWSGGFNAYQYFVHRRRAILGQRIEGNGTFVGGEFDAGSNSYYYARGPDVAADDQGEFVVVWSEILSYTYHYGGPYLTRTPNFSVRGRQIQPAAQTFTVGDELGNSRPRVDAGASGSFIVAWAKDANVVAQRYDERANALGTEISVSGPSAGQLGFDMGMAGDGSFTLAWTSEAPGSSDGSGHGLFARTYTASGTPVGAELAINTYTSGNQGQPVVAFDGAESFTVAWTSDNQDESDAAIIARRFEQDAILCTPEPLEGCLAAGRASLRINSAFPLRSVKWTLADGDAFDQSVLGDPQNDTVYTLCIYDTLGGTPSFAGSLTVLPGSLWRDRDPKGFQYKDTTGASQGVVKLALRTGAADDNGVQLVAKSISMNVPVPTPVSGARYFHQDPSVVVQLHNYGDACWSTEFTATATSVNDTPKFKAKTP